MLGRLVLHRKCGAFRFSDEQYCRFVKEVEGFCYTLISIRKRKHSKQDTAHARIYDRLLELCTPIACTGPSMRKDIGQAKLNLLKTLLA